MIGVYVRMMARLMRWPLLTLATGFGIVGFIFVYYIGHPTGMEAFPASEPENGTVTVITRGNYSPIEIRDMLLEVQDQVLQVPGIQDVILGFGGGESGPPNTIGQLQLQLQPWSERLPAEQIFRADRARVAGISGLEVQIAQEENGPPAGKAINLRLESSVYADLAPSVARMRDFVENQMGGAIDVEDGRPAPGIEWKLAFDRAEASKYGVSIRDLAPYVRLVTEGVQVGTYRPLGANDELDIIVRLPADQRSLDTLDGMRIVTAAGLMPLSNFVTRTVEPKVGNITRRNGVFDMTVAANLEPGLMAADKVKQVQDWAATQDWPGDVKVVFGGAAEQTDETNAFIMQAFAAAMFLIFLVLLMNTTAFIRCLSRFRRWSCPSLACCWA